MEESQPTNGKEADGILTIDTKEVADRLRKSGLSIGHIKKLISHFREANSRVICYRCCGIGHGKLNICGDGFLTCEIRSKGHDTDVYNSR